MRAAESLVYRAHEYIADDGSAYLPGRRPDRHSDSVYL